MSLLKAVPAPVSTDTVLFFSPHPDDETIASGGYLKSATLAGAKVYIVLVTDGNKHHLEKIRYNEFATVTGYLGVPETNLTYLNYPDGSLSKMNLNEVKDKFKNLIEKVKPTIILIPSSDDRHPDHRTTGMCAERAVLELNYTTKMYYYLVHFPNFPSPMDFNKKLFLPPPLRLLDFNKEWLSFPLTEDLENFKQNALMKYKTQLKYFLPKELILTFIRKNELFVAR